MLGRGEIPAAQAAAMAAATLRGVDAHWRDFVEEAEAAIATGERATIRRWRPISEAPRDGTEILAHCLGTPSLYGSGRVVVRWYEGQWELAQVGGYAQDAEPVREPTQWMPLPEPPNAE